MSGKAFDYKAKKRLARHIIGGDKQEAREREALGTCVDCGKKGVPVNKAGLCEECAEGEDQVIGGTGQYAGGNS